MRESPYISFAIRKEGRSSAALSDRLSNRLFPALRNPGSKSFLCARINFRKENGTEVIWYLHFLVTDTRMLYAL